MSDLIPIQEVVRRTAHNENDIRKLVKARTFPQPIKVGRRVLFVSHEVDEWIDQVIENYRATNPVVNEP